MKRKKSHFLGGMVIVVGLVLVLIMIVPHALLEHTIPAQNATPFSSNRSSIHFSEKTVNLKPVHSGEISYGSVFVKNIGNKTISKADVFSNCSCSELKLSQHVIKPGETIQVDFSIDTKNRYENFILHFVFTYTEDGEDLFDTFYVDVSILTPGKLVAEPSSLQFNKARVGESFSKNIKLSLKDLPENKSIEIIDVTLPDWLSADIVKQDTHWNLTLTGTFSNQPGRFVEFVQIKTNSTEHSEMIIPIIVEYMTDG